MRACAASDLCVFVALLLIDIFSCDGLRLEMLAEGFKSAIFGITKIERLAVSVKIPQFMFSLSFLAGLCQK